MAFVLDDLTILALTLAGTGTALEAKAQSDFQRDRKRKIREGFAKLDEDARKSEKLVREEGLDKLDPENELELAEKNDRRNAASLAKVSKQIRPARPSATTGFKGKVSGKFIRNRADAEIADTRKFKKDAINTGRFLSNAQTVVDRGDILSALGLKTKTQRGFTRGNQRVNNIELASLRPSATLQNLAKIFQIGGAVAGVGAALSGPGSLAPSTTRVAGGNQALLPATRTSPLSFGSVPTKTVTKDPLKLFVNF